MIKKFTLGAVDWKVKVDNDRLEDLGAMGLCEFSKALISIDNKIESSQLIEQTIYHEVIHAILDTIGKHDLSADEDFVQKFSVLLHQFEKTKK